jgi:NAD(P)-dependent dehydrogenase (short-subunit alcohol dehydrogenase family)
MRRVLVTGMSGTGKSTALAALGRRGFRVVDTDSPAWREWIPAAGEWLWREDRIAELLASEDDRTLHVSGCGSNQGKFYDRFDAIVLLSAPAEVIFRPGREQDDERLRQRARGTRPHPFPPWFSGAVAAGDVHPRDRCEQTNR